MILKYKNLYKHSTEFGIVVANPAFTHIFKKTEMEDENRILSEMSSDLSYNLNPLLTNDVHLVPTHPAALTKSFQPVNICYKIVFTTII